MRYKILLAVLLVTVLCYGGAARASGKDGETTCLILLEDSVALEEAYIENLHALLDLLPGEMQVGLQIVAKDADLQIPLPLTWEHRAQLHGYLELVKSAPTDPMSDDWERMLKSGISFLASRRAARSTIVALHCSQPLPATWQDLQQTALDWGVQLLEFDLARAFDQQAFAQDAAAMAKRDMAAELLSYLGLTEVKVVQSAFEGGGMQALASIPAGIGSLILQWQRAPMQEVEVVAPGGCLLDLDADNLKEQIFEGAGYIALHLSPQALPQIVQWEGDWQINMSGPALLNIWFENPINVQATVYELGHYRLISIPAQDWLTAGKGEPSYVLTDWRDRRILELNDLGVNGDLAAGDNIYSSFVPPYIGAGPAKLIIEGAHTPIDVILPPPPRSVSVPAGKVQIRDQLIFIGLGMAISGWGLACGSKKPAPRWRISQAGDGDFYRHYFHGKEMLAGTAKICQLQLAPPAAAQQFGLRLKEGDGLRLDVLSVAAKVFLNDERVFISHPLQHRDEIRVGCDTILIEEIAFLRVGRYAGKGKN